MNKITQAALAALVLGACSTAAFAEDEAARGGYQPPKPPIDWSKCNTLGCEKEIPITLEIKKKCVVTGGQGIVLSSAGGTQSTNYSIVTNTPYTLNLQTANAGISNTTFVKHESDATAKVYTTIETTKAGQAAPVPLGNSNHEGESTDVYTLKVTNSAVSASQKAGIYNDKYLIKAYY